MKCVVDNHNYTRNICEEGLLDLNLNQAVIYKISNFQEIKLP